MLKKVTPSSAAAKKTGNAGVVKKTAVKKTTAVKTTAVKKVAVKQSASGKSGVPAATKTSTKKVPAKKVVTKRVAAKKIVAKKVATKPAAKKTPVRSTTKTIAKLPVQVASTVKGKIKKSKLVRDSFTMPESEYRVLEDVKKSFLKAGIAVKKSELLRAGVTLLNSMSPDKLRVVIAGLPTLKAGRPKKGK